MSVWQFLLLALVVIGAMMMQNARHVDWADRSVAVPVFPEAGV